MLPSHNVMQILIGYKQHLHRIQRGMLFQQHLQLLVIFPFTPNEQISPIYVYKRKLSTDILNNLVLNSLKVTTTSVEFFYFSEN